MARSVYVETLIRADIDELWRRTQRPDFHQRWDLRFTEIDYLPRAPGEPQRFRYTLRPLPWLAIAGTGITARERHGANRSRTSALRFSSQDPISLIRSGSGFWRYIPTDDGIRFVTGYGYHPGWGGWGVVIDLAFRPIMGWATAWSFDRLRLWLESGRTPERSLRQALVELGVRVTVTVAALAVMSPALAIAVAATAILLPPLPNTPAARRCLRRPPDRRVATAPATLTELERP
ncbi:hypothetical protein [Microtetraspora sp. NBRC 16547]|uniref:hypothetical protein n=1 Tax=Microtetraspora sp. NBRC 16547 TaxID=3030993 RepID=UPI0024A26CDE|nr:hypothetical protein [Microtetraspora sp. NBRC 16547]GLW96065.1 hypothetical protein Misp02_01520 [Microtetraspora sp. NBRC 16547]